MLPIAARGPTSEILVERAPAVSPVEIFATLMVACDILLNTARTERVR